MAVVELRVTGAFEQIELEELARELGKMLLFGRILHRTTLYAVLAVCVKRWRRFPC